MPSTGRSSSSCCRSPPNEALGDIAGWAIALVGVGLNFGAALWLLNERRQVSFDSLLVLTYAGAGQLLVMQLLAEAVLPYQLLMLVWVAAAGVQPTRRALVLLAVLLAAMLVPIAVGGSSAESRNLIGRAFLFATIGLVLIAYVAYVRVQRVRLVSQESDARAEATAAAKRVRDLQWITDAALAPVALQDLLDQLLDRIVRVFATPEGAILLRADGGSRLEVRAARGLATESRRRVELPVSALATRIAREREAVAFEVDGDHSVGSEGTGPQSVLGVPLMVDRRLLGVLYVASRTDRRFVQEDVALLQLVADPADPSTSPPLPLLEREDELRVLERALSAAAKGRGSVSLIRGRPGHGTSSLLATVRRLAREQEIQVLSAVGEEIGRELTFGVALQLLEHRVVGAAPDDRERLFAGAARLAAPLFELGSKQALYEGHPFSLLHGLYWLCANLSDERPLLLTVDHAELADVPSLRFVFHLVQRLADLPLAVVLGMSLPCPPAQLALLEEIAQEPTTIALELPPLTPAGVEEAIRHWLDPDADDEFSRACFDATGGNPLFLRELARELAAAGVRGRASEAPRARDSGPGAIATAVLRRIEAIGPDALELARAIALLGDGAEIHHAARLAQLDLTEAWRLADELVRIDVLKPDDRLAFAHPIVRRALLAERSPAERADAHLEAARILSDEGLPVERVAEHLLQAPPGGGPWVVEVLMDAGRRARAAGSTPLAARYLRRALEELSSPEQGAHVLLELGHLEASAGDPRGLERLSQAMTVLDYPRLLAGAALSMGRLLYARGQPAEAATAFRRGAEALGDAD